MTEKLTSVMSMHELRELPGESVKLEKGVWIEISDFSAVTEEVVIKKRWEVLDVTKEDKDDKEIYTITCKNLDFDDERKIKEELSKNIIQKHHDMIKSSFVKCLIDGIDIKPIKRLKHMLYALRGEVIDEDIKEHG